MRLNSLVKFFSSLRLTVTCLALGLVLVFIGTLAQVDLGLYKAQNDFFRSFFVYWSPPHSTWKIPVLPGGYLIGFVLLVNLLTAHWARFVFTRKKLGIWLTHAGIILLLVGQLLTDMLSRESVLHLREGEGKNYSETERETELAVVEESDSDLEKVVAIPQALLAKKKLIRHQELPFSIQVKEFFPNSTNETLNPGNGKAPATQGFGVHRQVIPLPRVTKQDQRDIPSAIIEITSGGQSLGTWLVSEELRPQTVPFQGKNYEIGLRVRREYKPFTLRLQKFNHEVYAGTGTPKNFQSRVLLQRPETGESREVDIHMNKPLRYNGETFYQADWDKDDHGTILQVVHNPGWLTPYLSCIMVAGGLIVQFLTHLFGFARKWRTA